MLVNCKDRTKDLIISWHESKIYLLKQEGYDVKFWTHTWKEAYLCWRSLPQLAHKMSSRGCAFYHQAWCWLPTEGLKKWFTRTCKENWSQTHENKQGPGCNWSKQAIIANSKLSRVVSMLSFSRNIIESSLSNHNQPRKTPYFLQIN
jgi:hypothetical protein